MINDKEDNERYGIFRSYVDSPRVLIQICKFLHNLQPLFFVHRTEIRLTFKHINNLNILNQCTVFLVNLFYSLRSGVVIYALICYLYKII